MGSKKLSWIALFIALSAVGASIKIPAIAGSIALDSFPALVASVLFGWGPGVIIAAFGHLLSALIGGMPLGPFHFMIAIEMALLVMMFSVFYRRGKRVTASILFIIGNAFVAPLPFLIFMDPTFYIAIVPSLLIGSFLNTLVSFMAIPRLESIFHTGIQKKEASR